MFKAGVNLKGTGKNYMEEGKFKEKWSKQEMLDLKASRGVYESRSTGPDKKHAALRKAAENKVDNLVNNGKLTKEQGAKLKAKISSHINTFEKEHPGEGIEIKPQALVNKLRVKPLPHIPKKGSLDVVDQEKPPLRPDVNPPPPPPDDTD